MPNGKFLIVAEPCEACQKVNENGKGKEYRHPKLANINIAEDGSGWRCNACGLMWLVEPKNQVWRPAALCYEDASFGSERASTIGNVIGAGLSTMELIKTPAVIALMSSATAIGFITGKFGHTLQGKVALGWDYIKPMLLPYVPESLRPMIERKETIAMIEDLLTNKMNLVRITNAPQEMAQAVSQGNFPPIAPQQPPPQQIPQYPQQPTQYQPQQPPPPPAWPQYQPQQPSPAAPQQTMEVQATVIPQTPPPQYQPPPVSQPQYQPPVVPQYQAPPVSTYQPPPQPQYQPPPYAQPVQPQYQPPPPTYVAPPVVAPVQPVAPPAPAPVAPQDPVAPPPPAPAPVPPSEPAQ